MTGNPRRMDVFQANWTVCAGDVLDALEITQEQIYDSKLNISAINSIYHCMVIFVNIRVLDHTGCKQNKTTKILKI